MGFNCKNCKVALADDEVHWGPAEVWKPETNTWGLTEDKPWCAKCACVEDADEWDGEPVTREEYWDEYVD